MNDLDLKMKLAEELKALIATETHYGYPDSVRFQWRIEEQHESTWEDVTDREWLWIVAECEKKLDPIKAQPSEYFTTLGDMVQNPHICYETHTHAFLTATWQQRATAYFKTIGKAIE